eukprot:gene4676-6568_t
MKKRSIDFDYKCNEIINRNFPDVWSKIQQLQNAEDNIDELVYERKRYKVIRCMEPSIQEKVMRIFIRHQFIEGSVETNNRSYYLVWIEGRVLDEDGEDDVLNNITPLDLNNSKFSSIIDKISIQLLDKKNNPSGNRCEWVNCDQLSQSSSSSNPPIHMNTQQSQSIVDNTQNNSVTPPVTIVSSYTCDCVCFKLFVDKVEKSSTIQINLFRANDLTKRFELSPKLGNIIKSKYRSDLSEEEIILAMWQYFHVNNLWGDRDKKIIKCDEALKEIFSCEFFPIYTLRERLIPHYRFPKPIYVEYFVSPSNVLDLKNVIPSNSFSCNSFTKHGGKTFDIAVDVLDKRSFELVEALNLAVSKERQVNDNITKMNNNIRSCERRLVDVHNKILMFQKQGNVGNNDNASRNLDAFSNLGGTLIGPASGIDNNDVDMMQVDPIPLLKRQVTKIYDGSDDVDSAVVSSNESKEPNDSNSYDSFESIADKYWKSIEINSIFRQLKENDKLNSIPSLATNVFELIKNRELPVISSKSIKKNNTLEASSLLELTGNNNLSYKKSFCHPYWGYLDVGDDSLFRADMPWLNKIMDSKVEK